jgi:hypothetical protein
VAPIIASHRISVPTNALQAPQKGARIVPLAKQPLKSVTLLQALVSLLVVKQEDDEMVLQILFALYQYMLHPETRRTLLSDSPDLVIYAIDLLSDRNAEIRKLCDVCLDLVAEADASEGSTENVWREMIKQRRFQWHNAEWIAVMRDAILERRETNAYQDDVELESESESRPVDRFMYHGGSQIILSQDEINS